jgi:hypothetical protein
VLSGVVVDTVVEFADDVELTICGMSVVEVVLLSSLWLVVVVVFVVVILNGGFVVESY